MSNIEDKVNVEKTDNKLKELVKTIESKYQDNFIKQAELFKKFFDTVKEKEESLDLIKEFVSKETSATREEVLRKVVNENDLDQKVLYLGMPSGLGRKFENVRGDVKKVVDFLKDNSQQEISQDIKFNATTTTVLYLFAPERFIPIAGGMNNFLKELGIIENDIKDWNAYNEALVQLKEEFSGICCDDEKKFKSSFTITLSFASWLHENSVENILDNLLDNQDKPKNIILTGIPGTGKTHSVMEYLKSANIGGYEFVQFHPSYDYEDFIEGLKPVPSQDGQISFQLVDGPFKRLCKEAYQNLKSDEETKTYVMVIDEINRANLSRVFGELLYCLEYRGEFVSTKMTTYINSLDEEKKKEHSIDENNIGKFTIPENLIILGTMNEVDRSIDAFDLALRRRFIWEEVGFSETALWLYLPFFEERFQGNIEALIQKATKLNETLAKDIGINYQLGHTYYFKIIDYYDGNFESALCDLWQYHIRSIVREYCKIKYGEHEIETKLKEYRKIIIEDK